MKRFKPYFSIILSVFLFAGVFVGCSSNKIDSIEKPETAVTATEDLSTSTVSDDSNIDDAILEKDTIIFTDSSGREVEIPKNIERIAPSGPLAQVVLYTLCPDKVVGWSAEFTENQLPFINEKYASLPVLGNFYKGTLNMESIILADPQIIIDIGETKDSIVDDMNDIQSQTGVPTVFVHMDFESSSETYETVGQITGSSEKADLLALYIDNVLKESKEKVDSIPNEDRKTVYFGKDNGLTAMIADTIHTEVIDYAGGINIAAIEKTMSGGGAEISMETLIQWNPDVILFTVDSIYDEVSSLPEWNDLSAIKKSTYYEIPEYPYNLVGSPPAPNRFLGIRWLGNILYPEIFDYDMIEETKTFYSLFYSVDITTEQAEELLARSTFK